jgi:hypothetical protein
LSTLLTIAKELEETAPKSSIIALKSFIILLVTALITMTARPHYI